MAPAVVLALAEHGLTDAATGPLARLAVNAPSPPRWTPAAKDVLVQAVAEADAMAHRGVDVEHLVLAALDRWGAGEELVAPAVDGTSLAKIDALIILEFLGQPVHDHFIEVVTTEVSITICRLHFKNAIA